MDKQVAVVTGGTGGIGTEICKQLQQQGNTVVAIHHPSENSTDWQKTLAAEGFDIKALGVDITSPDECKRMADEITSKYGDVAVIVNSAGIIRDSVLKKMEPAAWDAVIDTNLNTLFYVIRQFIEKMIENKYGRIINISSVNGHKGQFGQTNYSAAKAGIYGLTKSLALETAIFGITVNSVSPGYTNTQMVQKIREDVRQQIIDTIPVKRLAESWEIARTVAFLAHKDSGYITGADISINGGLYLH